MSQEYFGHPHCLLEKKEVSCEVKIYEINFIISCNSRNVKKKTRTAFTGTLQVAFLIIFMHKHILNECSSMGGIVKKRSRGSTRSFYYNRLK